MFSAWLFYPVLWSGVFDGFRDVLQAVTNFPQYLPVLFMGKLISPQELPWSYLPVWIGITTPLAYQALFVIGCGSAVWSGARRGNAWLAENFRGQLLALAWVFGPIIAVIVLRPVLYDGWRQMFFIYPGIVLLSVEGARWLLPADLPPGLLAFEWDW